LKKILFHILLFYYLFIYFYFENKFIHPDEIECWH